MIQLKIIEALFYLCEYITIFIEIFYYMYIPKLFIHELIEEYFCCFRFLAIKIKIVMGILDQVFAWTYNFNSFR